MQEAAVERNIAFAVVSAGLGAEVWQRRIKQELARTSTLASPASRADALVVVVDKSFADAAHRGGQQQARCVQAIQAALVQGKLLLPVTVGHAAVPPETALPKGIRELTRYQALALDHESDLPGVVARLVVAGRTAAHPYRPDTVEKRRVFISYRRDDSWYWASLLARALALRLGAHNVFFDLGSIAPGTRFDREIEARLHDATDFVILVGVGFLAPGPGGRPRLFDPMDFVRQEIGTAIRDLKAIHIVLVGDAALPSSRDLPQDIAAAFDDVQALRLTDHRAAESVGESVLRDMSMRAPLPAGKRRPLTCTSAPVVKLVPSLPEGLGRFVSAQQKLQRFVAAAVPPLAACGWQPADPALNDGLLVMHRPDAVAFRFVLDAAREELVLEERVRSIRRLGLKSWIKRSIFPVGSHAANIDVLRPPDRQVEAMQNPAAYLDRGGRFDLDTGAQPPLRPGQMNHLLRPLIQPGKLALEEHAQELVRARARGGLAPLKRVHLISLGRDLMARGIAVSPATGQFLVGSDDGVFAIDPADGTAMRFGLHGPLGRVRASGNGKLAVIDDGDHLSVLDRDGTMLVKRRTPYSAWQRLRGRHADFATLSWSDDNERIAIGASDRIWLYRLKDDAFEQVALRRDGQFCAASALFVPSSDELRVLQFGQLWRVSCQSGRVSQQFDIDAGSAFHEKRDSVRLGGTRSGLNPSCMALSANGSQLVIGGSDAQMLQLNASNLLPVAMRVWHWPLVEGRIPGVVEALAYSRETCRIASVANDDRLVLGGADGSDAAAHAILHSKGQFAPVVRDLCWSPDGTTVAVVNGIGGVELWHAGSAEQAAA